MLEEPSVRIQRGIFEGIPGRIPSAISEGIPGESMNEFVLNSREKSQIEFYESKENYQEELLNIYTDKSLRETFFKVFNILGFTCTCHGSLN